MKRICSATLPPGTFPRIPMPRMQRYISKPVVHMHGKPYVPLQGVDLHLRWYPIEQTAVLVRVYAWRPRRLSTKSATKPPMVHCEDSGQAND
jgi:hypothetical protein